MKKKISRLESNKAIRQALVRNSVDLASIQFSCAGKCVTLSGSLKKQSGTEFTSKGVEALVGDLQKSGMQISSDLDNWNISGSGISKKGGDSEDQKKKQKPQVKKEVKTTAQ